MGKGFWEAKKIANPDYVDDDSVYKYADFGFIGFDLWQVKGNTIFDNIILTDDKAEADSFAKKWKDLSAVEKAKKKERTTQRKLRRMRRSRSLRMTRTKRRTTTTTRTRRKRNPRMCDRSG